MRSGATATKSQRWAGARVKWGAQGQSVAIVRPRAAPYSPSIGTLAASLEVRSVSEGEDAQGEALVTVECDERTYRGSSVSTNIVESGARAFLEVINRIEATNANADRHGNERRLPLRPTLGPDL